MTQTQEKPKMISLKEQLKRDLERKHKKFYLRAIKRKPRVQEVVTGNKDSGIPYRGKDRFSGMFKKFADRSIKGFDPEQPEVIRVFVYDNNKYNGNGTLKD